MVNKMNKNKTMSYSIFPAKAMKPLLVVLLAALVPLDVQAATPDAGSILQEIKPARPALPSSGETGLTVEQKDRAKLPETAPFEVKRIEIVGHTLFDTATLHALVANAEGQKLSLSQLEDAVARITEYYRSRGYPLARAVIPAQAIRDGVVRVQVIEAQYGKIGIVNRSEVGDDLLKATLAALQSGQVISQEKQDRPLLLLSDVPGVSVSATLKPGAAVGTSDMEVDVEHVAAVAGNVLLDNYGNRYTGKVRLGGSVHLINSARHGDVVSLTVLSSGSGLSYGKASYDILLNGQGTHAGAAYSALSYSLGDTLAALQGHGTARIDSLWLKHPLVRSSDINLYGLLEYSQKQLQDRIDVGNIQTDRSLRGWTVSLNGDLRDSLLSGGINTWKLGLISGNVGFDNAAARLADAAAAQTEGGFTKWDASYTRLQRLNDTNTLYFAAYGQWTKRNLDSSERLSVGGASTVRAYDMGAVSGDAGYVLNLELRHELAQGWQATAFLDSADVTVNRSPWVAGANTASLNGAGIGFNWTSADRWGVRACIASRVGPSPALAGNASSTRGWIEISRGF